MKDYLLYVPLWAYSWGLSKNSPVPFLFTGEWVDFSFQRKKDWFLAKWRATEEKVTSLRKKLRRGKMCQYRLEQYKWAHNPYTEDKDLQNCMNQIS